MHRNKSYSVRGIFPAGRSSTDPGECMAVDLRTIIEREALAAGFRGRRARTQGDS